MADGPLNKKLENKKNRPRPVLVSTRRTPDREAFEPRMCSPMWREKAPIWESPEASTPLNVWSDHSRFAGLAYFAFTRPAEGHRRAFAVAF
jgi:hypothetical protein